MTHDKLVSREPVSGKSREVYDYSNCWTKRDNADVFVGKNTVDEIGFPLDISVSNKPLEPPYVVNYYATLEKSLSLPDGVFGELYKTQAIHLMAYIGEMVEVMKLVDTDKNPLIAWANSEVKKFNRPRTVPPELEFYFEDEPEERQSYVAADQTLYSEIIHSTGVGPYKLVYDVLNHYRDRGREIPVDPPFAALDSISDSLGIKEKDGGVFTKIALIYNNLAEIYHTKMSASDTIEQKLSNMPLLKADSNLLPIGVISIDGFSSKEIADPVMPEIVYGEATLSHSTGDFHSNASVTLWKKIRDCYHIFPEYYNSNSELPVPPNWDSGYKMEVPYLNKEGQIKNVVFVVFNQIGNINLDAARQFRDIHKRYGSETIFLSPGPDGHNAVWEPRFIDTSDVEYLMSLKTEIQTTPTVKCIDINFGI